MGPKHYLEKRSMRIDGHRTSVALEPEFWAVLEKMAKAQGMSMPVLLAMIDGRKQAGQSLASAARVAALRFAGEAG